MELADIRHQVKTRRRAESAVCVPKMRLDLIGGREGDFNEEIPLNAESECWSCSR